MMRILAVSGSCGHGTDPAGWWPALEAGVVARMAPRPRCPRRLEADLWRRMGPLDQLACVAALEVLDRQSGPHIGVVWGSDVGSVPSSRVFRRSLERRGPDRARPSAFQTSVHNAGAGFLAMAGGLVGPSESLFAGGATGLLALLAAERMLMREEVTRVLVVVGGDAHRDAALGHAQSHLEPRGDAVAAVLLASEGVGPSVELIAPPDRPTLARRRTVPFESPRRFTAQYAIDDAVGLNPAAGLWAVAALARGPGGTVVDHHDDLVLAVRVTP